MKYVDAHTHLELFALKALPLEMAKSRKGIIEMIKRAESHPIVSWGWNEDTLDETITKNDIDQFPFPVLLIRIDGHMGVVNGEVIKRFNLRKSDKFDPDSGHIYEDKLWDIASNLKRKVTTGHLINAQAEAISRGIVEVHDFVDARTAEAYFKLRESNELKIGVVLMPYYDDYEKVLMLFDRYGEDKRLKFGWVKIFVDGSIGARTAYMSKNYSDKASKGILLKTEEELIATIGELENKGLKIAMHAIGDGAIEIALNALEKANIKMNGHRIEHAEMINEKQANKVKEMDVILCIQPNFNPVFMKTYVKALGKERADMMNRIKMLHETGVSMIFGSDMMPFDPEIGINYASEILGREKALYYYGGWRNELNPTPTPL